MCFYVPSPGAADAAKPHYRLHFFLFDGKTPLWWVSRPGRRGTTLGCSTAAAAVAHAGMRYWSSGVVGHL